MAGVRRVRGFVPYLLVVAVVMAGVLVGGLRAGDGGRRPVADVRAGACAIGAAGVIGERWQGLDGADGPLGCPAGVERPGPDGARLQAFEHGEVVFAPRQGAADVVVAYQRGRDLVVHWGPTAPFRYEKFFVAWHRDGRGVGQREIAGLDQGTMILPGTGDGDYTVTVKGCQTKLVKGTVCHQGPTPAATVRFRSPQVGTVDGVGPRCEVASVGRIGERWRGTGAERGPLGCPSAPEQQVGAGRRQAFQRGEIAWLPDQGPDAIMVAYRLWSEAVFEWSGMGSYDYFRYDAALDGVWLGHAAAQVRTGRAGGRIWTRLQGFGEYSFRVKGCQEAGLIGKDRCAKGWTVPVRLRLGEHTDSPNRCALPVGGVIAARWHELGAWDGPLGCPRTGQYVQSAGVQQDFDGGTVTTAPDFGPAMAVALYQVGGAVVLNWGRAVDRSGAHFPAFRVEHTVDNVRQEPQIVTPAPFDWANPGGSGEVRLDPGGFHPKLGRHTFQIFACVAELPAVCDRHTPKLTIDARTAVDASLPEPARGHDAATGAASHAARATAVVEHAACVRPLSMGPQPTGEDEALALVARFQALAEHPGHRCKGEPPTALLVNEALKDTEPGPVGTDSKDIPGCPLHGEYDTYLKGLIAVGYRYPGHLLPDVSARLYDKLLPLRFGHDPKAELKFACVVPVVESENHLLLIESERFLTNQLLFDRTGDARYDNYANDLGDWLLRYLQDIARHDFLEFNSRNYQRYSMHALLNLAEFARQPRIQAAAQILLDYTTTKFAASSDGLRRVGPFRRLAEHANSGRPGHDAFFEDAADPQAGFFLMYLGPGAAGLPADRFPARWVGSALIAGLSTYRPPKAAYVLAGARSAPSQQVFQLGNRRTTMEVVGGGVEIYYRTPTFLLSAGGMFLPSGYGFDELTGYKHVGVVQATSLLPTRGDLRYTDLIRFDPWPNTRYANNTCVHMGFACGADLVVPQRWLDCTRTPKNAGPWLLLNLDTDACGRLGLYVAAYRTRPATANAVPGYGLPPNLGLLHAVDASTGPFEEFARQTRERNAALPAKLTVGDTYTFRGGDGHSFRFWLQPAMHPYKARVVAYDGRPIEADVHRWPLADGPFLTSPGHDGYFEIRYPGCAGPLVLDFRATRTPRRTDLTGGCRL